MDKQEFLNSKYMHLCQQLGDAEIKKTQLQKHIDDIKSQIEVLNKSFNIIAEYEAIKKSKENSNV